MLSENPKTHYRQKSDHISFFSLFKKAVSKYEGAGFPNISTEIACIPKNTHDPNGYYEVLGVDPGASKEEIKKAYRRLISGGMHPDLGGNEEDFRDLTRIYQTLIDDFERSVYNNTPKEDGYFYFGETEIENAILAGVWEEFLGKPEPRKDWFSYFSFEDNRDLAQKWYKVLLPVFQVIGVSGTVKISIENVVSPGIKCYAGGQPVLVIPSRITPNFFVAFYIVMTVSAGQNI